jgi:hypothetical protein
MAPQVVQHPGARPTGRSPYGHHRVPQPRHHDDSVEAHYACMDGWVFLGRIVESEHDLDGEVVEYERVPCRRCADSQRPYS